jgi:hypothetical protein
MDGTGWVWDKNHDVTTLYLSILYLIRITMMYRMPYLSLSAHSPIFFETNKHPDTNRKIVKKRVCSFRPCSFSKPSTRLHRTNPHAHHYPLSLSHHQTIKQQVRQARSVRTNPKLIPNPNGHIRKQLPTRLRLHHPPQTYATTVHRPHSYPTKPLHHCRTRHPHS